DRIVTTVKAIADEHGRTPSQVALAWLRYRDVPTIPIIGTRKLSQLQDNVASLEIKLDPEQLRRLDEVSAIEPIFPNSLYAQPMARTLLYGGIDGQIEELAAIEERAG